ncbi:MAG: hypothetical protein K0U59_06135 [Gammaproteobacteria bacterium]|nr:hypothetical protein [Gammaproteobacteria bacterium]
MITRFTKHTSRLFLTFVFMFAVTACGGGGGGSDNGNANFLGEEPSEPAGPGPGPGPGGATGYTLKLTLLDNAGNQIRKITSASPAKLEVLVTRGSEPVANQLVEADSQYQLTTLEAVTGRTNNIGVATFRLKAGDQVGADILRATITVGDEVFDGKTTYEIIHASRRIGYFDGDSFTNGRIHINPSFLFAGGSTELNIAIVDKDNKLATTKETVFLSSLCSAENKAGLPASVTTSNGQISATYEAKGCIGEDTITAQLDGRDNFVEDAVAISTVKVAPPNVNSIKFISATPKLLAPKGTGGAGRQETSKVLFQVVDDQGDPLQGVTVHFELVNGHDMSLANDSQISNLEGFVTALVQSGYQKAQPIVVARIELPNGEMPGTPSSKLAIGSGLPIAGNISLSADKHAVGGGDVDNVKVELTVSMNDSYGNPVVDGITPTFVTEYGAIDGSCALAGGSCTVTWRSQNRRFPEYHPVKTIHDDNYSCAAHDGSSGPCPATENAKHALGAIHGLRSTITMMVEGDEYFVDKNGNNLYDEGELFTSLPEPFYDHNEDGVYTPLLGAGPKCYKPSSAEDCIAGGSEEGFWDSNGNEVYDQIKEPAWFNGFLCPNKGDGVYCTKKLVTLSEQITIVMSDSNDYEMLLATGGKASKNVKVGTQYVAYISDKYNNPPPDGTNISVATRGYCSLRSQAADFTVLGSNEFGAYTTPLIKVALDPDSEDDYGFLDITMTIPNPDPDPDRNSKETSIIFSYDCQASP